MDAQQRHFVERAIAALERVIEAGPQAPHRDVAAAVRCIAAYRNHLLDERRRHDRPTAPLDHANALLSLAYGAEAPLVGFHLHRVEQVRDGLRELLEPAA